MIKICSLDFLNKETFETDIVSADGSVVIKADTEVTQELILKLYFRNIYVNEPIKEEIPEVLAKVSEKIAEPETETEEAENGEQETEVDGQSKEEKENEEVNNEEQETDADGKDKEEKENKEARTRELGVVSLKKEEEKDDNKKGPRMAEPKFGQEEVEQEESKSKEIKLVQIEVPEEKPEEKPLEFDEQQAKRIVDSSLKIGKMLDFSAKELKDLEQVAYYSNIGISKFKVKDLRKKEFNKMRAYASYEKLMEDETVTPEIAEMIKYCANNYDSNSFPFNSKIPYHHIVAITSYYETSLLQTNSKQETLLKMLQLGGNQFNIFILHKFINMMREANG
jgi:hypothetical protein